ncbi:hypothetical protein [Streptomyces sp. NPDC059455]|uniref:hypothetical protein n=1 Tax=Streptomyces sp. NPDC059455 TaxID=3346837 RepID=UPI00367B6FB5
MEAAARLYATDLAAQLGIDHTVLAGPATLGDTLTHRLSTRASRPPGNDLDAPLASIAL